MEKYLFNIVESILVIIIYFVLKYFIGKAITKAALKFSKSNTRVNIIKKVLNFILGITGGIVLVMIWGVKQSDLLIFITSLLTVLGIAFFAQWSIISNITAAFIIFFNHPAKIGDEIEVFDKDFPVKGKIEDIGIFFVKVKTESKDTLTIPSNVFIQKMIVKRK